MLLPELQRSIVRPKQGFTMVRNEFVVSLYSEGLEQMDNMLNKSFEYKQAESAKAFAEGDLDRYVWLRERPFRLQAFTDFMLLKGSDQPADVSETLISLWSDSEWPGVNRDFWLMMFKRYGKKLAAEAQQKLPETLWRGTAGMERKVGLSWTSDREQALWFAKRNAGFSKNLSGKTKAAVLLTTQPTPESVLAFYDGRGESEFVLDPSKLKVTRTKL